MENEFGIVDVVKVILRWWKKIAIATFIIASITAVISLMVPVYYEAGTTFYAASPELAAPAPLSTNQDIISVYGDDTDIDRLLSISQSNELKDFLISKFNLYERYEIDPEDPKAPYKVQLKLSKLYQANKNKFDAIFLTVEDRDPETSAQMANSARNKINEIAQKLIKESQSQTSDGYARSLTEKETLLTLFNDSLSVLRVKYNVIDTENQGQVLAENSSSAEFLLSEAEARYTSLKTGNYSSDTIANLRSKIAGLKARKRSVDGQLKNYNKGINQIKSMELQLQTASNQVGLLKERKSQLDATLSTPFSALHVVEEAHKPVIKSRPKRTVMVLGAGALTFIFGCLIVLFLEGIKKIDWKKP